MVRLTMDERHNYALATTRQLEILLYMLDQYRVIGKFPTVIQTARHFKISRQGVWKHLRRLQARRYIAWKPNTPNSFYVPIRDLRASFPLLGKIS